MTRKEQIEDAWMNKYFQGNHRYDEKTFKEAVEWADKTMIARAVKWLQDSVYDRYIEMHEDNIEDFKKAMQE